MQKALLIDNCLPILLQDFKVSFDFCLEYLGLESYDSVSHASPTTKESSFLGNK